MKAETYVALRMLRETIPVAIWFAEDGAQRHITQNMVED